MSREKDFIEAAERLAETKRTEDAKQQCLYDFGIAADYGYQYALQHPQWIPVEEELPEERKVVWVRKHFNKEVLGEFDIYDSAAFCNGEFQCDNSCNVTHWMPIVPPRKEE